MSHPNRHMPFQRNMRDTRLVFSNLLRLFDSFSNIVITWYEILAGLSILSFLSLVAYLIVHFVLWLVTKEPSFSAALCNKFLFPNWFFPSVESSGHSASSNHPPLARSAALHGGRSFFRFRLHDWRHHKLIAASFSSHGLFRIKSKIRSSDLNF